MSRCDISIYLMPEFRRCVTQRWLRSIVEHTIEQEGLQHPIEVDVVIANEDTVRQLNADYRGLDEATDVLSFAFQSFIAPSIAGKRSKSTSDGFIHPPQQPLSLGEVVISYPQAKRQAAALGKSVKEETALLVAHGVLHLLGYDHYDPEEKLVMWQKQDLVVAATFRKKSGE